MPRQTGMDPINQSIDNTYSTCTGPTQEHPTHCDCCGANAITFLPLWFHVMERLERLETKPRYRSSPTYKTFPDVSLAKKPGNSPFRNFQLHAVQDEYVLQLYESSHTSKHVIRGSRIPTHYYEPNEPTSPVGRWSRPVPVPQLDEHQTYLKIEQKSVV